MKLCVFGGQYGSEGKGSAAEWLIQHTKRDGPRMVAIGENSPNSGHTCSLGKTRNLPASSFFADIVILGPDSAVDDKVLCEDLDAIKSATGKSPMVYIHRHAAVVFPEDRDFEREQGVVSRISSTGSGSGASRAYRKMFRREEDAIVGRMMANTESVTLVDHDEYFKLIQSVRHDDCIFECSQGALLDVNWGTYPFVTSRCTLPRVAIERNGLATLPWAYFGVYRTYPIRTGGPSGPTGAPEIRFSDIGVEDEVATVTKRVRRVFEFSLSDFKRSITLTRPNCVMFTHLDYIHETPSLIDGFMEWYKKKGGPIGYRVEGLFLSNQIGFFVNHFHQDL